jgi:carbonic anhydrase/acetyltransferase-like protein (isoleucine patch superfamily)
MAPGSARMPGGGAGAGDAGKTFPDHTLIVGSPAKAVRTLDAEEIEGLIDSARRYVEKSRQYLSGLKRIDGETATPKPPSP